MSDSRIETVRGIGQCFGISIGISINDVLRCAKIKIILQKVSGGGKLKVGL
jgi:hypothetical protein